MKITDTDNNTEPNRLMICLSGEAYSGKTHMISTFPDPCVVSFDDTSTLDKHPGIKVIQCVSVREFRNEVLPYVHSRRLHELVGSNVETFAVDSLSIMANILCQEIQGTNDKMRTQDWGTLLNDLTQIVMTIREATKDHSQNEPVYHAVVTTHLRSVEDETGAMHSMKPAIAGQFRDLLPRLMGSTFLCERTQTPTIVNGKSVVTPEYVLHKDPPSRMYTCGDRVGGGRFNELPPTIVGNSFDKLCELWDIPDGFWVPNNSLNASRIAATPATLEQKI